MQLTRLEFIKAARHVVRRLSEFSMVYAIGALYSFYSSGLSVVMTIQLFLSLWLLLAFQFSYAFHIKNRLFNLKRSLILTDIPTVLFSLFLLSYYFIFYAYRLYINFDWVTLVILFFGFSLGIVIFRQGVSYNVILTNLTKYFDTDIIEITEEEWIEFNKKMELGRDLPVSKPE